MHFLLFPFQHTNRLSAVPSQTPHSAPLVLCSAAPPCPPFFPITFCCPVDFEPNSAWQQLHKEKPDSRFSDCPCLSPIYCCASLFFPFSYHLYYFPLPPCISLKTMIPSLFFLFANLIFGIIKRNSIGHKGRKLLVTSTNLFIYLFFHSKTSRYSLKV